MISPPYSPPRWLRNGHTQTMLGSVARRSLTPERERTYLQDAITEDICTSTGAVLRVKLNLHKSPTPLIVLIHGWLGCDESSYMLSTGGCLWREGFATARINLRDHGDTSHLNEALYHSARTDEVVALIENLRSRHGVPGCALVGFSLGGNFALRVARDIALPTLGICPAINPAETLRQIDDGPGSTVYRGYFLRKWQRALVAKATAFPDRYDFSRAYTLRSVSALTDYFVRHHSEFRDTQSYFDAYDLTDKALDGVQATILIAADDPIIPRAAFRKLPSSLSIVETPTGGHNAFLKDAALASWSDEFVSQWCRDQLGDPESAVPPAVSTRVRREAAQDLLRFPTDPPA